MKVHHGWDRTQRGRRNSVEVIEEITVAFKKMIATAHTPANALSAANAERCVMLSGACSRYRSRRAAN